MTWDTLVNHSVGCAPRTIKQRQEMTEYRRAIAPGGTFFFTVVTWQRQPILTDDRVRTALREAIKITRAQRPSQIDAWVLLPDHLHCVWTLPDRDSDFSIRWATIKRHVSSVSSAWRSPELTESQRKRRESALWQRRFWEHQIRDDEGFGRHLDYIHWNPVKHGLVNAVADWPYSSFHRLVRRGTYPADWGGRDAAAMDGSEFGE